MQRTEMPDNMSQKSTVPSLEDEYTRLPDLLHPT